MELHLSVPRLTGGGRYGGGHLHDSRLSLQLWAHGQEVLPDAGYPFQPANNRYFHMSPLAHNTSVAEPAALQRPRGPFGPWGGHWARSALLDYDDGTASGGQVSAITAASPGPAFEGITRSERTLIQVRTGPRSGYVVDAFWLQGGAVHESYLRQTEDEAAAQTVSAPLVAAGETMAAVLRGTASADKGWRHLLRSPQRVDTRGDFNVTWTGEKSGVAIRMFLAPQEGSTSWLSRMPRVRPTAQDAAKKDSFPGWHLYRRREVRSSEITLWAAIHEPVAKGERPKIGGITWGRSADGSAVLARIDLAGGRTDFWMLALPDRPAAIGEWSLRGRAAGVSTAADGGAQNAWRWAAAGTVLARGGSTLVSGPHASPVDVLSLTRRPAPADASPENNGNATLRVAGTLARPPSGWLLLRFADGSGRGLKVDAARPGPDGTTLFDITGDPGMEIDRAGMRRVAFPLLTIPGKTTVREAGAGFVTP
ncbi:Heparinase II/III-like protein [Opitutaceae bacterium TAV1]|nr:Heparinase II/III-like protein [Opitutaceae bacterium TAV1]